MNRTRTALGTLVLTAALTLAPVAAFATGGNHGQPHGHTPVAVCHDGTTLIIDDDAVEAHLAHGDVIDECAAAPTPEPTVDPTPEPTVEPTAEPEPEPTVEPTPEPEPTTDPEPTTEPTPDPTGEPTAEPTTEPTPEPTADPVTAPQEPQAPAGASNRAAQVSVAPAALPDTLAATGVSPWLGVALAAALASAGAVLLTIRRRATR